MESPQGRVSLRFYAELNDHLSREQRYKSLERVFYVPGSVKDLIESCGVPHTEVELIVANGESVPFTYVVRHGDRVAVYPMFESFDVTPELKLGREALRQPKFVLDVHLGRLAAYLRMLGFDAVYGNRCEDAELVRISSKKAHSAYARPRAADARRRDSRLPRTADREPAPAGRGRGALRSRAVDPALHLLHGVQR